MKWVAALLLVVSVASARTLEISLPPGEAFLLAVRSARDVCRDCTLRLTLVVPCNNPEGAVEFVLSHPEIFTEHDAELSCSASRGVHILEDDGRVRECELLPGTGLNCD